jgi:hypothetical protein
MHPRNYPPLRKKSTLYQVRGAIYARGRELAAESDNRGKNKGWYISGSQDYGRLITFPEDSIAVGHARGAIAKTQSVC